MSKVYTVTSQFCAFVVIGFLTQSASASSVGCAEKYFATPLYIESDLDNPKPASGVLGCMATNIEYREAMGYLCSPTGKDFSPQFQKYLSFYSRYQAAAEATAAETDPNLKLHKASIQVEIEDQWNVFGFRIEVESSTSAIEAAMRACKDAQ
jgi:hypothetical protein